jgi:hypothetical protein
MRKVIMMAMFIATCASFAMAQGGTATTYNRGEFGVLYNANWVDDDGAFNNSGDDRSRFDGFEVNGGYNFSRYFGVQGAVSHNWKNTTLAGVASTKVEGRLTQVMGGFKVQDNSTETVVKPYARALFGVGRASVDVTSTVAGVSGSDDDTGFASVLGGGLDFRLSKHVDLTTSLDYNPVRLRGDLPGDSDEFTHNLRAGVGIKFRFGGKD